jgi:hypothetical protein
MKTILFCTGYVVMWFFAGVAIQVGTFLAQ